MVITILVSVRNPEAMIGGLKPFLKNIEDCGYPKGKIEVVFMVVSQEDQGLRTFLGPPVVKVRYYKDYVQGLNDCIEKALGDLIVLAEIGTRFVDGEIMQAARVFSWSTLPQLFLRDGWFVFRKVPVPFYIVSDVFCVRTYLIIRAFICNESIIGRWGRLNRKEILRSAYKFDLIGFRDKFKLFLHYLGGV